MRVVVPLLAALLALQAPPSGDKEKLRAAMGDQLAGPWFYDDFEAGLAEAKRSGKPLLVVLRCVPCKPARSVDRVVSGRQDPELAKAMDRFVCVRIVQGFGLDLSLFQFDWRQTWAVFLMNGDRAIYGRYDAREANDVLGLRKALEGALELHERWPANRAELAGKTGPAPRWKTPEEIPALQDQGKPRAVTGRNGCLHCHNVLDGAVKSLQDAKEAVPERHLAPYPTPQRVGIMLSTKERATVSSIDRSSPAEKAGLREGDRIVRFGGQPILSWADVQWVLYLAKDGDPIRVDIDRAGAPVEALLTLPAGWRGR
ncbi:MAG: PDZ domain-containing protein [Planctomycetaceae bacterium]|nr:PDZ domain-containing protein [Planctomycetaceae bacterium]